ncbi:MAG: hypothetical protein WC942_11055 [Clostridia bacterium]|jgi:hypothetical protein
MAKKKMKVKKNIKKKDIKKPLEVKNKKTDEKSLFKSISGDINKKTISKSDTKKTILKSDPETMFKNIQEKEKCLAEIKTKDKHIVIKDENHLEELIETLPKRKVVHSDIDFQPPKEYKFRGDRLYNFIIKSIIFSSINDTIRKTYYDIDVEKDSREEIDGKIRKYVEDIKTSLNKDFTLFLNNKDVFSLIINKTKKDSDFIGGDTSVFRKFGEVKEENRKNKSLLKKIFNKIFKGE